MTFKQFWKNYLADGGSVSQFARENGIGRPLLSQIISKRKKAGLTSLNRILHGCNGYVGMGELVKEFRPDLYKDIIGGRHDRD